MNILSAFFDIGKSSYFPNSVNHLPVSEIRISDIGKCHIGMDK